MGLPDFHTSQLSYTNTSYFSGTGSVSGLSTKVFKDYSGYGEVIEARIRVYNITSKIALNDIIKVSINGLYVFYQPLFRIIDQSASSNCDMITLVKYIQTQEITYKIRFGLKFNESFAISYYNSLVGDKGFIYNICFGLY